MEIWSDVVLKTDILPSSKAFLTPTTVTELTTLFFFLFLPKEQSEENTSDIAFW